MPVLTSSFFSRERERAKERKAKPTLVSLGQDIIFIHYKTKKIIAVWASANSVDSLERALETFILEMPSSSSSEDEDLAKFREATDNTLYSHTLYTDKGIDIIPQY